MSKAKKTRRTGEIPGVMKGRTTAGRNEPMAGAAPKVPPSTLARNKRLGAKKI